MIGARFLPRSVMVRAPLIVHSVIEGRRYLAALVFMLIGCVPLVLLGLGIVRPPALILIVSTALIFFGPISAANTWLGYPRLTLTGNRLILDSSYFTSKKYDLTPLGAAYVAFYPKGRGLATDLIFRSAEDEAAHRAAEKFPHAPEPTEAVEKISINAFVGHDVDKGEALAKEINAHRGF
jgi:hypothetical protein